MPHDFYQIRKLSTFAFSEIISVVDKTEAEFNSMENIVGGDIYIGGGETDAIKLIAQIAKDLRESYPNIHYHLYSGNSEDVTERLRLYRMSGQQMSLPDGSEKISTSWIL